MEDFSEKPPLVIVQMSAISKAPILHKMGCSFFYSSKILRIDEKQGAKFATTPYHQRTFTALYNQKKWNFEPTIQWTLPNLVDGRLLNKHDRALFTAFGQSANVPLPLTWESTGHYVPLLI